MPRFRAVQLKRNRIRCVEQVCRVSAVWEMCKSQTSDFYGVGNGITCRVSSLPWLLIVVQCYLWPLNNDHFCPAVALAMLYSTVQKSL